jgi:hypothetical protein
MDSSFNILPIEIHKEVLYDLNVRSLLNMCKTEKYIASICNNNQFWHEYVKRNYDPEKFLPGQESTWNNITFKNFVNSAKLTNFIKNWKDIAAYLEGDVVYLPLNFTVNNITSRYLIEVKFDDTVKSIAEKINNIVDETGVDIPRPVYFALNCEVSNLFNSRGRNVSFSFRVTETYMEISSLPEKSSIVPNTNIGFVVPCHELILNGHEVFRTLKDFDINHSDELSRYYDEGW